ncbi:MAG: 4-hydroxy-3-methylbut-2-enyl diphosphate reductase [Flavobacteriales bacterium]|nr:4-hydroxy-3-methylbut-2-enyl diphosphate reductase [Flavobacteriales bacterium]
MKVNIDPNSGFCFGVVYAIEMAEDELAQSGTLYCLGDIVHNNREVERLTAKGLKIINHEELAELKDCKVLIRAHGEPPQTYEVAIRNNIELIDASCPVVLKLQHRVRNGFERSIENDGQIIIYGKEGHAEVNGLVGQTGGKAIIVTTEEDLQKVDFTKPIYLYSQTTKSTDGFYKMKKNIEERIKLAGGDGEVGFVANDTICRQVANREPHMKDFASRHDVVVFVSGKKSSNGKILYDVCKSVNPDSYFVSSEDEIQEAWFAGKERIGVCGATSTPMWLMEKVANCIETMTLPAVS